jgi:uncharacterized protein YxeA
MTKKQYIVVIAVPLVIIVTIVSILSSGVLDISEDRVENIKIEVSSSGSWEGILYNNEEVQSISGFTKKTIIVFRPDGDEWTISFEAEKKDDTMGQLKVKVKLIDGTTLGETQTVEPYGKVSISMVIG